MNIDTEGLYSTSYSDASSTKSSDMKKLLLGALAGAAVGTLVGGLYTEKGIETRNRVSDRSRKIAGDIKEKASDITEDIKDKVSTVTTPIAHGYQSTKKVATKLFKKEKPKTSIAHLQGNYSGLENEHVEISATKVILALLGASLAGTAIWSFTTEKGKATRKQVVKGSKDLAGNVKEKASKFAEFVAEAYEDAKEGAEELREKEMQKGTYVPTDNVGYNRSANFGNTLTP